ncbi:hypothetical protein ORN12_19370 [Pantoea vagans]|uniref:hypothetical protein n=1 Tax=Pantoea vagans TaxID=470934 RepID=UPI002257DE82|nr:hypothetical protein [Pantoea vagans]MCX3311121.1 hypothetical protein [Pantoea vagans]
MSRSEQEKVNIMIGEAVLSLLNDYVSIRKDTIIERLEKILKEESDNQRRHIINNAIQQTFKLASNEFQLKFSPAEAKNHLNASLS